MIMKKLIFFLSSIVFLSSSLAQNTPFVEGEILVMLHGSAKKKALERPISSSKGLSYPIIKKCLSEDLSIFLLSIEKSKLSASEAVSQISQWAGVQHAQLNHRLEQRKVDAFIPNDPNLMSQWALNNTGQNSGNPDADIDAPEAWDLSTGGLTIQGDTIVVAVIDQGIDLTHEDLIFWKNHAEIPDNGIDDDGNGYIDDFHGWNANDDSDEIPTDNHGTSVAGIIAANGNNGIGIAGISWNTQIMPLVNLLAVESEVVEAYGYALKMRKRYNETAGAEGAFVVASNSSFGLDFANPANFPIWCSVYDSLGTAGILSVASTTNASRNVDTQFDMPSGCQSDFLITVTNTTRLDSLNLGAGYGGMNVDLGAPGTQISTTLIGNRYGTRTGTSFAAPQVSGVIALLYSAACPEILSQYKRTPESMAREFKKWIFEGVDPLNSLVGKSVTEGRLNAYNTLILQQNDCSNYTLNCLSPTDLRISALTDVSALFGWSFVRDAHSYALRYKASDDLAWTEITLTDTFFQASGLLPCTDYVFQVASQCTSDSSGFLASRKFSTEGCCEAPPSFRIESGDSTQIQLAWEPVFGADAYILEYKKLRESTWQSIRINDTQITLNQLPVCERFHARLATDCGTTPFQLTDTLFFETSGCGFCLDTDYCESKGNLSRYEWIESVQIGPIQNVSGNNGGYAIFSDPAQVLIADTSYAITLIHGFDNLPGRQFWKIWIDVDQDGNFATDGSELFYDSEVAISGEFSDTLHMPASPLSGNTRMRVSMKFSGILDPLPPAEACEIFPYGEVEDYCIFLEEKKILNIGEEIEGAKIKIYPNPVTERLSIESDLPINDWQLFDAQGRLLIREEKLNAFDITTNIGGFASGIYYLRLQTKSGTTVKKIQKY